MRSRFEHHERKGGHMLIKRTKGWEIPEREATSEAVFLNRRALLAGAAGLAGSIAAPSLFGGASAFAAADSAASPYPAKLNDAYPAGRSITPEEINGRYNNFYEFGSSKQISVAAQALKTDPWAIKIDGMVEAEQTIDFADLLKKFQLEERVYRHRCVEAWSMTVPWTGFPMSELVKFAKPLSSAKFIRIETFKNPQVARGQRAAWYPWPYVEGLTMAEAMNDLTFMVTGAYGKPIANQFGAPIRLHMPWKYGFKSIKSMVRITFTDKQPVSFWEEVSPREYGFWANVNPQVPHARWSQASERVLETGGRIPTVKWNGYGEWVADLYADMKGQKIFY